MERDFLEKQGLNADQIKAVMAQKLMPYVMTMTEN